MADQIVVVGGVDTHTDFHQAAVIDYIGRHLASAPFPTTPDGYRRLLEWMRSHGDVLAVGVEGTGAYGSELARFLGANEVTVGDVDRPDRKARRANGKSDPPMPTRPRPASCPAAPTVGRKPATASWRPSDPCGSSGVRPSKPAPRRSTRSARSSSQPLPRYVNAYVACPLTS